MNKKIRIYKMASYINLCSMLILLGILSYSFFHHLYLKGVNANDLLIFSLVLLTFVIFAGNFYYALKLTSRFKKGVHTVSFNNKIRITFIILEILLAVIYSVAVFYAITKIRWSNFLVISHYDDISFVIALVCFLIGYPFSLLRLLLTRAVLKKINQQDKEFIEQLGEHS